MNLARRLAVGLLAVLLFQASAPLPVVAAPQARQITAADLSGLSLRGIGPASMSGRMVDVAVVESDTYTFYVATATGGVWKTTNNGVTYTPVFEDEPVHSVGDIAVSQRNPEIVWVGTGERANRQSSGWGDGVYKSIDGGESWTHMGLRDSLHIGRVAIDPDDDDTVFVAAMGHLWGPNEERGLYRTRDGGETWERVLYVDQDTGAVDVAIDPDDSDIVYAAMYQRRRTAYGFHGGGPGSGLYRSDDGGDSWEELTAAPVDDDAEENPDHMWGTLENGLAGGEYGRIAISIHRNDPDIVYVTLEQGLEYTASTSYETRLAGIYRSENRGRDFEHMSNWNPRPMYASQVAVDPSDDQRIYQMNQYSYSDDGGRTWTTPRQSVHGDDRFIWIDPADSRHVIKADDGSLAISYDRGVTWLWTSHLPVSQYYRIAVDNAEPHYNVYGGLQDNGSWVGPNAVSRSEGILNSDWVRIGGGDGFLALPDPSDPDVVYAESQYLGLQRLNMATLERQDIRPGDEVGYKFGRRNWRLFGTGAEPRVLEQEMEPANWDGPYILSPHDPKTVYAGTQNLYVSNNAGSSWRNLGRMSEPWERSEVQIMGQDPTRTLASLDDGVPYFATLTSIAESPLRQGLLYIGTDDGNVQVSEDGGDTFTNVAGRFPGLPARTWVADLAPSPHDENVVFAAFDGHREDDYANYIYRSDDRGNSWTSVSGNMPHGRVVRAVEQDVVNPQLLWAATEFGMWFSIDGGHHWFELKNNMPTLPINDFVIHPREHDLVLGTHGRGVWILDSVNAIRELLVGYRSANGHLFSIPDAVMERRAGTQPRQGDMIFRGDNPPNGAIIDYWLTDSHEPEAPDGQGNAGASDDDPTVTLTVHDANGNLVRTLERPGLARGVNRTIWNFRHDGYPASKSRRSEPDPVLVPRQGGGGFGFGGAPSGPLVVPGTYTVRLTVNGDVSEQSVTVTDDPRINVTPTARRAWTAIQLELGDFYTEINDLVGEAVAREDGLEEGSDARAAVELVREQLEELRIRVGSVSRGIAGWTGAPTADQRGRLAYYRAAWEALKVEWGQLPS